MKRLFLIKRVSLDLDCLLRFLPYFKFCSLFNPKFIFKEAPDLDLLLVFIISISSSILSFYIIS